MSDKATFWWGVVVAAGLTVGFHWVDTPLAPEVILAASCVIAAVVVGALAHVVKKA